MKIFNKINTLLLTFLPSILLAVSVEDYIDKSKCDQIIYKQLYNICYSYKYKVLMLIKILGLKLKDMEEHYLKNLAILILSPLLGMIIQIKRLVIIL